MAEQDIREDQMTSVSSVDYVRGLKGKDSVLIKRDDLVRITPKLNFNGDFKDPANFPGQVFIFTKLIQVLQGLSMALKGMEPFMVLLR